MTSYTKNSCKNSFSTRCGREPKWPHFERHMSNFLLTRTSLRLQRWSHLKTQSLPHSQKTKKNCWSAVRRLLIRVAWFRPKESISVSFGRNTAQLMLRVWHNTHQQRSAQTTEVSDLRPHFSILEIHFNKNKLFMRAQCSAFSFSFNISLLSIVPLSLPTGVAEKLNYLSPTSLTPLSLPRHISNRISLKHLPLFPAFFFMHEISLPDSSEPSECMRCSPICLVRKDHPASQWSVRTPVLNCEAAQR